MAIAAFAADPDVRIEDGVLTNSKANYYFTLPERWTVKDSPDAQHLTVYLPDSTASVTLLYDLARSDGNPISLALVSALGPGSDFTPDNAGTPSRLGGQMAIELRGARTGRDGGKERVRCIATERGKYTLTITSAVSEAESKAADSQIDQVIRSFAFGKPPRKRGNGAG